MKAPLGFLLISGLVAPDAANAQVVRGQVVDSLTRAPIANATVVLLGAGDASVRQTRSDGDGLFLVRAPDGASYRLRVERDGYRVSTFPPFEIAVDQTLAYMLLVAPEGAPAELPENRVAAMVERVCPGAGPNHPIVVGLVQDAAGRPVPGASVRFGWASLPDVLAQDVSVSDVTGVSESDSLGRYAICGVPRASKISLHASLDESVSDFVRVEFVGNVVVRGGESVTRTGPFWVEDFTLREPDVRSTELVGSIADARHGGPVRGATVSIQGTDLATTSDSSGAFVLSQLPAGPARLLVRKLGNEPVIHDVILPRDSRLELPDGMLVVGARTELEPIVVDARAASHPLDEFNERRSKGQGAYLTREEWLTMGNPIRATDVLQRMSGVRLEPGPDIRQPWVVSMRRGGPRTLGYASEGVMDGSNCPPLIFLDRQFIGTANTVDIDATISLMDLAAVEAHGSVASIPNEFNRRGSECGVIAFWTHRAQRRSVPIDHSSGFFNSTPLHFVLALGAVVGIFFGLGEAIHF